MCNNTEKKNLHQSNTVTKVNDFTAEISAWPNCELGPALSCHDTKYWGKSE